MSAPVDVLAVLSRAIRAEPSMDVEVELMRVRAAVAELIEAAQRANGDHVAPHDCYATGPMTGDPILDLVACPGCELSAALARVKGGEA